MVKHTQTIRRQQLTTADELFDHFVRLALKWRTTESSETTVTYMSLTVIV